MRKSSHEKEDYLLESIYHKAQRNIWDGKSLLPELIDKHRNKVIELDKLSSIKNIFSVILHGEFAAWKISAELSDVIDDFYVKMSLTSQVHDEARHFYVMRDYLSYIGLDTEKSIGQNPSKYTEKILKKVLKTKSLSKKILGMHLMVEPIALTIFQLVRESNVDPVLSDLLEYYERDESRHLAIGVIYLPRLISKLNLFQKIDLFVWQCSVLLQEIDAMKELEGDFKTLGFTKDDVFRLAEKKQLEAVTQMNENLGLPSFVWDAIRTIVSLKYRYFGS